MQRHYIKYAFLLIVIVGSTFVLAARSVAAYQQLQDRSIEIGDSRVSVVTSHKFSFKIPAGQPVGSILFEYCTHPILEVSCNNPTGSNVAAASFDSQSGETGFSVLGTTTNSILLSRPQTVTTNTQSSYSFSNITNHDSSGPFFVRITVYQSTDASGAVLDFGAVASATTNYVFISTIVPPILVFCTGVVVANDCSNIVGDFVQMGQLSSSSANTATSQFSIGTNASFGYVVSISGPSLTSGNVALPNLNPPATSRIGTSQFGINLRANTNPVVGADPIAAPTSTPGPSYNSPNVFSYSSGDTLVQSDRPVDYEHYTVSYLVNVASNQQPGIYNTTLNFLCTGTF